MRGERDRDESGNNYELACDFTLFCTECMKSTVYNESGWEGVNREGEERTASSGKLDKENSRGHAADERQKREETGEGLPK